LRMRLLRCVEGFDKTPERGPGFVPQRGGRHVVAAIAKRFLHDLMICVYAPGHRAYLSP